MPLSFFNDTVTRIRAGIKSVRGSELLDWDNADRTEITGCNVQPLSTSVSEDGRVLAASEGLTLYAPPGSDIRAEDRVEYQGNVYSVRGIPQVWKSPTGRVSNVQYTLERWSG